MPSSRLRTAAAVLLLSGVTTLGAGVTSAVANPGDQGSVGGDSQQAPNPAVINPGATVQLSITKYLGEPSGATGDGTHLATPPGNHTLAGVRFDVYRVYTDAERLTPVDLTSSAGWAAASALSGYRPTRADVAAGSVTVGGTTYYLQTSPAKVTTDSSGVATFTQANGVGLYLVNENVSPADTITDNSTSSEIPATEITASAPFLVTLPMTDPTARHAWMYDVYVYPKNQRDTVSLAVTDRGVVTTEPALAYGAGARHRYDYTLTSTVTDGDSSLGAYVLYQKLDPWATFAGVTGLTLGGTTLDAGDDYTVFTASDWGQAATPFTGGTVSGGPLVTIVLTATGREKLESNRDADLVTTFSVVAGARDADGVVEANASFVPNDAWWAQNGTAGVDPNTPTAATPTARVGIRSNEVLTRFGDVEVIKTDAKDSRRLAGAVFRVYTDLNPDGTCAADEAVDANLIGTTAATDADGTTRFRGLQLSNYADGKPGGSRTYCLVETTAPSGYELDAAPRSFTIPASAPVSEGVPTTTVNVPNQKSNLGNELPLTGGAGIGLLSGLGALLIGGGVVYYVASQRRRGTTSNGRS